MLPTADKPLVKGHNFFVPWHVGVLLNRATDGAVHVRCGVLASMRDTRYNVKCVVHGKSTVLVWDGSSTGSASTTALCELASAISPSHSIGSMQTGICS